MIIINVHIILCRLIYPGYISLFTFCNCITQDKVWQHLQELFAVAPTPSGDCITLTRASATAESSCKCCQTLSWVIQLQNVKWNFHILWKNSITLATFLYHFSCHGGISNSYLQNKTTNVHNEYFKTMEQNQRCFTVLCNLNYFNRKLYGRHFVIVIHYLEIWNDMLFVGIIEINECVSNPCENDGTCTDMEDGYTCACESGFTGTVCQTGIILFIFLQLDILC